MDKRTQAEKDRTKRKAAEIRAAARTPEQKLAERTDTEDRFGGSTLKGKPVTDAVFDDEKVAGDLAEHLDDREHPKKDEEVKEEDEKDEDERDDECEDPKTQNRPAESNRRRPKSGPNWRTF